jgi:hypothetical protein
MRPFDIKTDVTPEKWTPGRVAIHMAGALPTFRAEQRRIRYQLKHVRPGCHPRPFREPRKRPEPSAGRRIVLPPISGILCLEVKTVLHSRAAPTKSSRTSSRGKPISERESLFSR